MTAPINLDGTTSRAINLLMAEAPDILALRHVSLPVDVTDAEQYPEIERARQHAASLSPERRKELGL